VVVGNTYKISCDPGNDLFADSGGWSAAVNGLECRKLVDECPDVTPPTNSSSYVIDKFTSGGPGAPCMVGDCSILVSCAPGFTLDTAGACGDIVYPLPSFCVRRGSKVEWYSRPELKCKREGPGVAAPITFLIRIASPDGNLTNVMNDPVFQRLWASATANLMAGNNLTDIAPLNMSLTGLTPVAKIVNFGDTHPSTGGRRMLHADARVARRDGFRALRLAAVGTEGWTEDERQEVRGEGWEEGYVAGSPDIATRADKASQWAPPESPSSLTRVGGPAGDCMREDSKGSCPPAALAAIQPRCCRWRVDSHSISATATRMAQQQAFTPQSTTLLQTRMQPPGLGRLDWGNGMCLRDSGLQRRKVSPLRWPREVSTTEQRPGSSARSDSPVSRAATKRRLCATSRPPLTGRPAPQLGSNPGSCRRREGRQETHPPVPRGGHPNDM